MKKILIAIGILVLLLVVGFFVLNSYIYNEKQADFVVGETVTRTGKVLAVDLEKVTLDGPVLLTLWSDNGEVSTIAVPSMGLPLCAAYQKNNIGDVYLIKPGETIEVRGKVSEEGTIIPCESEDHYLRPKPIIVKNFEGEADPSRMTLNMKTWVWQYALYNDGRRIEPNKAGAFTLTFDNGKFSATTDCNGVGGSYSVSSSTISFTEMVSTLMYCDNSQESEFVQMLSNTSNFLFTSRGELVLELKFDSGSVVFR